MTEIERRDPPVPSTSTPQDQKHEQQRYLNPERDGECSECQRIIPHIKKVFKSEKHVLSMHVEYWVLGQSGKKGDVSIRQKVRHFTDNFFKNVCSLRNSRGGVLAIHVQDMDKQTGPSLDNFDQKVSKDLSNMIEDDSPYTYNYQRQWFEPDETSESSTNGKYIVVIVKGSSAVSTKSFNTLVPFDGSKERPRAREVAKFLSNDIKYGQSNNSRGQGEFQEGQRVHFVESRSVQFKSLSKTDLDKDTNEHPELKSKSLSEKIVFRLIEKLDLLQYITAFTKLTNGGSFFLGIEEEKKYPPMSPKSPKSPNLKSKAKRELDFTQRDTGRREEDYSSVSDRHIESQSNLHRRPSTKERKVRRRETRSRSIDSRSGKDGNSGRVHGHSRSERHRSKSNSPDRSEARRETRASKSKDSGEQRRASRRSHKDERKHPDSRHQSKDRSRSRPSQRPLSLKVQIYDDKPSSSQTHTCSYSSTQSERKRSYASVKTPSSAPSSPSFKETRTGHNVVRGFEIPEAKIPDLKKLLEEGTSQNMLWLKSNGDCIEIDDVPDKVDFLFHCTVNSDSNPKKYVLEVRVNQEFHGLVFYTKGGPEVYRLGDTGEDIVSIPVYEWMKLLKRASKCASCMDSPEECLDSE